MKTAHALATYALIVFSLIHVGMAPVFFDEFTMNVMWYVAQGLMGLFAAFLNIACRRLEWNDPGIASLAHLTNLLGLLFAILYSVVDSSPPSFAGVGLFVVLGGTGVAVWRARDRAES